MRVVLVLIAAYGLCFGLQNKAPFLHRGKFLKSMLACSYCTGFHAGWITWLTTFLLGMQGKLPIWKITVTALVYAFASSAFCYLADTHAQWVESQSKR